MKSSDYNKKKESFPPFVLIGTYKAGQLEAWKGYYNYPVSAADSIDQLVGTNIKELWLFCGKKQMSIFAAKFVGVKTRAELVSKYSYPAKGSKHSESYLLFKTSPRKTPTANPGKIIVRASDFSKRSPLIAQAIRAFLLEGKGNESEILQYVPRPLTQLPSEKLFICEGALQLDFYDLLQISTGRGLHKASTVSTTRLKCLDFFAGSGLVSVALANRFDTVWANDISPKKALVYNANNPKGVLEVGSIADVNGKKLPQADLAWGSFPCQDLSLAGNILGLNASRSGLFWQWRRVLSEIAPHPPVIVAENVVGLVSANNGEYYVQVHNELAKLGYQVGAVMLDAARWLPQSRKRIFVIGLSREIDASKFDAPGPIWCHPEAIQKVAPRVNEWHWWKLPEPKEKPVRIEEIVDFTAPTDSKEEMEAKLSLIKEKDMAIVKIAGRNSRRVFPGYRRTRNHRQVLEIRADGVAGCLRTPCGGSSRQILIINDHGMLKTRLLTVRETARLMGAPDSFTLPGSYNDGYMAMGDAVAAPVVSFLAEHLLAPAAAEARERTIGYEFQES